MLRFARYLPEFGWQPLVLTGDTGNVDRKSLDEGLLDDLPSGMIVCRKAVWRPIERSSNFIKGRMRAEIRKESDDALASESSGPVDDHSQRKYPSLGAHLRNLVEFFMIPDRQIGWFLPALRCALSLVRQHRPEVILSSSSPVSSHLIAVTLKRLTGLPVVLDFRDPWARKNWPVTNENVIRRNMQRQMEQWCVRGADRVILNTPECRDDFVKTYRKEQSDKFAVLPNGYDPKLVIRVDEFRMAKKAAGKNGIMRLCHPGFVYCGKDMRPLIAAIARLSKSGRHVILDQVGEVDDCDQVLRYAEQLGVRAHIVVNGQLPHAETLRHMSEADIFVLIHPGTTLTVPSKLYEMLPFRRPVLALTEPAGADTRIINHYELGAVAPPADDNAIAQAILTLTDGHAKYPLEDGWRQAMGAFDGRELAGELAALLDTSVALSPRGRRRARQVPTVIAEKPLA
jgi:glycosyltransferase involved in cell wall biosynthesis